jgi:hypothetical protein
MPSVLTAVWSWMRPGRTVPAHRVRPWPSLTTVGLRVFCLRLPEMNARRRVGRRGAGGPGSRCRRCAARTGRQQAARSCPRPRPGRRPTRRRAPGCRAGAPSCLGPAGWPRQRWWVSPADRSRRFRRSQRPAGHRCIAPSRAKAQGLPLWGSLRHRRLRDVDMDTGCGRGLRRGSEGYRRTDRFRTRAPIGSTRRSPANRYPDHQRVSVRVSVMLRTPGH